MNSKNSNDVATFVLETTAPYSILDFDQGLCLMTGYSPREISNKICTLDNLLYVEDFTETIASINYQLSISNLVSIQHRIVTKSGDILTVLCNGQAFSLNDGRDVLQCVFTDITNLENAANETAKAKTDLEIFANTVPSGVSKHLLDNGLTLTWANNYFYNMFGYTNEQYSKQFNNHMLSTVANEDLALVIEALADLKEDTNSTILSFRIRCADDSLKWVNAIFARAGELADGFPVVNLVITDITNLKIAEMKAMLEEQKYLIIADISEELPFEYDILTDTVTFAEKFSNIFDSESVIQTPAISLIENGLVSSDTSSSIEELFTLAKSGTEYHATEFKLNTRNSGYQWYFSTFSTIYDENKIPIRVVGLLRNIHSQKMEQQKLLDKAESDQMTGLLNKATVEGKIKNSLHSLNGNNYNVFMLVDIDDFKNVNDTYGHLKGDEVIINIANILKAATGQYDYAGRLGGDEFCLFFSDLLDTSVAKEKASIIADELRKIYPGPDNNFPVTLSIGIASTNQQIPYSVLLENADTALYQAKLNGKNQYYCYKDDMERAHYKNDRHSTEQKHDKIISQLLPILFDNINTYEAIDTALSIIGKNYSIDVINIYEYCYNTKFVDCTHQWCKTAEMNNRKIRQHIPSTVFEELAEMENDGILYSSDTSLIKLNSSSMTPQSEGVKKLVQTSIMLNNKCIGYISFNLVETSTIWASDTISDFHMISRLLSDAVCTNHSRKALSDLREDSIRAFNIITSPLIVFDRDTNDILFYNDAAGDVYEGITHGSKCFTNSHIESGLCKEATIRLNNGTNIDCKKAPDFYDDSFDIYCSPIKWSENSSSVLLYSTPHKLTKSEKFKYELEHNIEIEKRVAEASYRDIITGYGNFEKFKVDAQEILDNNSDTDYVMFYFNIKNFKYINETYGHNIGDNTLKTVADVLNKHLSEGETFSRIINDTYIMLIRYGAQSTFMNTFNSIRNEVHDACRLIQDRFVVDFITGILIIDETMHSYNVIKLVDRAMMASKSINSRSGMSYAFYDDEYHKAVLNEAQLENSMYDAMTNHEFCAYVQPKYDIEQKHLSGGELLVRWLSPSKGFLEPAAFVPNFEKNGFIYNIDMFMLEEACKSIRHYLDSDIYALPFSVNVSRTTLAHPDFMIRIQEIVERYFIPHHYIEFEITESTFSEDYETMIEKLKKLRSMDYLISMDDFGTGYSSLTLLKDLPIDIIKLDHDFLARSAANDKNSIAILKGIIDIAHALDIKVVSEGIETSEQLDMLTTLNCEIGQGFLFAKPMPIADYDKLVSSYSGN